MTQLTVLIVDDEIELAKELSEELKSLKWQVKVVHDGVAAIQAMKSQSFDIVISDVCLPEASGIQVLRKLRETNLDTIALLMSGFASIPIWEAYDYGANAFLGKPFLFQDLIDTINRLRVPIAERWNNPTNEGEPWSISGHIELDARSPSGTFSFGRGGMFISCPFRDLNKGAIVSFSVQTPNFSLDGVGRIMWTRDRGNTSLLQGLGLEFLHLEENCRKIMVNAISQSQEKAYIPKGSIDSTEVNS